ncbi:MAG: hypothetical protein QXP52_02260 [Candidatus Aenigmatarchaeota archaeon]
MIYRISLVHMYYSKPPTTNTPNPFAELRVFVFKDHPLSLLELNTLKRGLKAILERLAMMIQSINIASIQGRVVVEEGQEVTSIDGNIITEIHGFEVEEVDYDEVAQYFRSRFEDETPPTIPFDVPFRYVRFYDLDGDIKTEYNEWDLREIERESEVDVARRVLSKEMIRFLQKEYFPVLREMREDIEKYEEEYEKMIKKLRGGV